jgi:hypothetical protein
VKHASVLLSQKRPLKRLNKQVPVDIYETRLKNTVLLYITDLAIQILVSSIPLTFPSKWTFQYGDARVSG